MLLLPIIPFVVFAVSQAKNGGTSDLTQALNVVNPVEDPSYSLFYALTEPDVIVRYLRLLIVPLGQSIDPEVHAVTSIVDIRFLLPSAIIFTVITLAWKSYRKQPDDRRRALILFGVLWFFLNILPSSSIIPLPDFMAEHRSYLPSIGFFIVMATFLDWAGCRLAQNKTALWPRMVVPSLAALLAIIFGVTTIHRNEIWQSQSSLWADAIVHSPGKARPWGNLAVCHFEAGEMDQAITCFKTALDRDPSYGWGYMNLGRLYNIQNKFTQGVEISKRGITLNPSEPELYFNLGISTAGLGRIEEAKNCFNGALKLAPMHAASHKALGQIYATQQKFDESLHHLQTANTLMPGDPETLSNLADLRSAMQHTPN